MHLRSGTAGAIHRLQLGRAMPQIILRLPQVKARTGLSRTSIYEFVKRGSFPRPVAIGARAVGWLESGVETWISGRIAAVDAKHIAGARE